MMLLPGIGAELAAAIRAVNAAWARIPPRHRPAAAEWDALERKVSKACRAGDRDRALNAIEDWREHYLTQFTRVLLHAPLEAEDAA